MTRSLHPRLSFIVASVQRALLLVGLLLIVTGCCAKAPQPPMPSQIIDTHIHLYDTSRPEGVPWPRKDEPVLFSPHLHTDYLPVARANGVTSTVIVEASDRVEDNQWLLDLVKDESHFVAIVGNLLPGSPDFRANLDRFGKDKRWCGLRVRSYSVVDFTDDKVIADLKLLADRNLSLDLLTSTASLEQIEMIARRVPNLRVVINHLAGAKVDGNAPDATWIAQVKACAKHPNVYCKVSGLDQQAGSRPAPTMLAHYTPVLDVLWESFGEDRLVYASNWPVTNLRSDYKTHLNLVLEYFQPKGQAVMDKVFWKNAMKVYGLPR